MGPIRVIEGYVVAGQGTGDNVLVVRPLTPRLIAVEAVQRSLRMLTDAEQRTHCEKCRAEIPPGKPGRRCKRCRGLEG